MKKLWVVDNPRIIYTVLLNLRVSDLFCSLIITNWKYQWGSDQNFAQKASKKVPIRAKSCYDVRTLVPRVNKTKHNF